jgi:hypothetical protein
MGINNMVTLSEEVVWIPMLVLSYAQSETIFQNKHPKDPTMHFSSLKR